MERRGQDQEYLTSIDVTGMLRGKHEFQIKTASGWEFPASVGRNASLFSWLPQVPLFLQNFSVFTTTHSYLLIHQEKLRSIDRNQFNFHFPVPTLYPFF